MSVITIMRKKDFELIANILLVVKNNIDDCLHSLNIQDSDKSISDLIYQNVYGNFTSKLSKLYPRFDKEKFLQACGIITQLQKQCPHYSTSFNNMGKCSDCGVEVTRKCSKCGIKIPSDNLYTRCNICFYNR